MTGLRLNHRTSKSPKRTGGDDQTLGACYGLAARIAPDPTPFDVLTDITAGPTFKAALTEARRLCSECPIWRTCLAQNRGETWARAIITGKSSQQLGAVKRTPPTMGTKPRRADRANCGTISGEKRHRLVGEKPCDDCREAARAYNQEWRRRKREVAA